MTPVRFALLIVLVGVAAVLLAAVPGVNEFFEELTK